jgi:hypothetical protein
MGKKRRTENKYGIVPKSKAKPPKKRDDLLAQKLSRVSKLILTEEMDTAEYLDRLQRVRLPDRKRLWGRISVTEQLRLLREMESAIVRHNGQLVARSVLVWLVWYMMYFHELRYVHSVIGMALQDRLIRLMLIADPELHQLPLLEQMKKGLEWNWVRYLDRAFSGANSVSALVRALNEHAELEVYLVTVGLDARAVDLIVKPLGIEGWKDFNLLVQIKTSLDVSEVVFGGGDEKLMNFTEEWAARRQGRQSLAREHRGYNVNKAFPITITVPRSGRSVGGRDKEASWLAGQLMDLLGSYFPPEA